MPVNLSQNELKCPSLEKNEETLRITRKSLDYVVRFRSQSDHSEFFPPRFYQSRVIKTCFGTSCDIQSLLSFLLLFPVRCTCCVGDVFWTEKNCQCCRKYSLLDLEKLAKSTAMSKCKCSVSNTSFCRVKIIFNDR